MSINIMKSILKTSLFTVGLDMLSDLLDKVLSKKFSKNDVIDDIEYILNTSEEAFDIKQISNIKDESVQCFLIMKDIDLYYHIDVSIRTYLCEELYGRLNYHNIDKVDFKGFNKIR